jgi:hypothetical protein
LTTRLESNLRALTARIEQACKACEPCEKGGRAPKEIELVCVTKSVEPSTALELSRLGVLDLGENRLQELVRKADFFQERGAQARWHFIGHLQRNKVRRAVGLAAVFHSIDSLRLLDTLQRACAEEQRTALIYLEVELTGGVTRSGFRADEIPAALRRVGELDRLRCAGLMTLGPAPSADASASARASRAVFARLRELRDALGGEGFEGPRAKLSMGMTSDLEAAIAEGSDVVRVGSALFEGVQPGGDPVGAEA